MNDVAIVSIIFGILLIAGRGPFIFAPDSTRDFYLKLLSTNNRIRLLGLIPCALSVAMILGARGEAHVVAQVVMWLGYFLFVIAIFGCLIFPSIVRQIVTDILEASDNFIIRGIAIISVLLGVLFLYLGFTVLINGQ